ncbi:hypothetical protein BOX15_Mlig017142g2, partial [Macrostomum lignano]
DINPENPLVIAKCEKAAPIEGNNAIDSGNQNPEEYFDNPEDEVDFKASSLLIALRNAEDGEIPCDAETVLVINQTLQELVAECLRRVESRISEVAASKSALEGDAEKLGDVGTSCQLMLSLGYGAGAPGVAASDDHEAAAGAASASMLLGGGRLPQLRLARRGLIRSPFFSVYDSGNSRIVCPPNADGLQKRNRAELCLANLATFAGSSALYTGKVSSLSNRQGCLKKLLQLVAEFYRETRLRPLLSRQAGLAERMRSSAAVSSAIKSTRIAAAELDSEIKRLQNSSTDQLLGRLAAEGPNGGAGLINFDAVLSDLEGQRPSTGIVQLTARSLRLAYANVLRPGIDSSAWKSAEDARLIALVDELGERNWGAVSAALSSSQGKVRPPLACAQRWLSRHRRSRSQEQQLPAPAEASSETVAAASVVSAVNESIATQATGRIDWRQVSMQLKLYPKSYRSASELWRSLAPDLGYDWPASDRLRLLLAVDQFGPFRFFRIAQYVGTRTDLACRKAVDHLLTRDQPPWSYADDRRLFLLVPQPTSLQDLVKRNIAQGHSQKSIRLAVQKFIDRQVYNICWTDLLSMFPGRSAPGLAWRWRQLVLSSLVWERVKASVGVGDDTRRLLLRTPLMAKLLASGGFLDCNSGGSGGDQQVATTSKQEPTAASKEELSQLLMDADEGFLLPRPLPGKVTNSRFKLERLRRDATAKAALWRPIVSALTQSVNRQNFDKATRLRLHELLLPESEDRLWLTLQTAMEAPQLKTCFNRCKTVRQYRAMVPQIVQSILSLASSPSKQSSGAATNAAHADVASTSTAAPKEPPPTLPASLKSAQAAKKRRSTAATASATFEGDESTRPKKRHRPDPAVEPNVDLDADDDVSDSAFVEKETDDVTMLVDDDNDVEEDGDVTAAELIDAPKDDTPDAVAKRALANRIASRLATKTRLLDLPVRRYRLPPVCRILGDSSGGDLLKLRRNCAQRVSEFFRVYLADTDAPPMPLNMSTASAFRRLLSSRERLLRQSMDAGDDDDDDVDRGWQELGDKFHRLFAWPAVLSGMSFADCRARAPDFLSQEELQLESFDDDVAASETRQQQLVEHRPASHLTARADRSELNRGGGGNASRGVAVSSMRSLLDPRHFLLPKPKHLVPANSSHARCVGKMSERRLQREKKNQLQQQQKELSPNHSNRKRLTAKDLQQFKTECVVGDYRLDSLVNVALGNGEWITVPSELLQLVAMGYRPQSCLLPQSEAAAAGHDADQKDEAAIDS